MLPFVENGKIDQAIFDNARNLLQLISNRHPSADLALIEKAVIFAENAHRGQYRASGEPYVIHPIAAAEILAEQCFDTASIVTALLHDTVEDTNVKLEDIATHFSPTIAKLVDGVTKLKKIDYQPIHIRQAENFRKLLLAMSKDLRVLLVKLADRIHNMRTLTSIKDRDKHMRIAHETMEIYAPLAERMGMHQFKNELEDLAFAILYPDIKNSVCNRLAFLTLKEQSSIKYTRERLLILLKQHGVEADIVGRQKTPYSIWRKMERKKISFDQLSDILAFRVLVPNITDCYKVLGIIHTTYKAIVSGFKDYISLPKTNGYQSIHTLVIGEQQQRIEVQIRTREMDEVAKFGVAAHWAYKGGSGALDIESSKFKWIHELIDVLKHTTSPEEVLENTRLDLYGDQVFCFTPDGDLISLPTGATPIDFAFCMHSNIGLTCVGAKVNSRAVSLNHKLQNGDQVEIVTSPTATPSPSWENFAVTGKARASIKKFIRHTQHAELVNLGRIILMKAMQQAGKQYNEVELLPLLNVFQKKTIEEFLFAVGRGLISKIEVLQSLYIQQKPSSSSTKRSFSILKFHKEHNSGVGEVIPIHGLVPGLNTAFAQCCNPLPGDKITGIIHPAQGIVIHIMGCSMLSSYTDHPEKWLPLSWGGAGNELYIGHVRLSIANQPGALAQVTRVLHEMECNLVNIKILSKTADWFQMTIEIEVKGATQLQHAILGLRKLNAVYNVERAAGQK